jgi:hypothetical protein
LSVAVIEVLPLRCLPSGLSDGCSGRKCDFSRAFLSLIDAWLRRVAPQAQIARVGIDRKNIPNTTLSDINT